VVEIGSRDAKLQSVLGNLILICFISFPLPVTEQSGICIPWHGFLQGIAEVGTNHLPYILLTLFDTYHKCTHQSLHFLKFAAQLKWLIDSSFMSWQLFNCLGYVMSNIRKISELWIWKDVEGCARVLFHVIILTCASVDLGNPHISQDSSSSQDLNPKFPEYKVRMLTIQLRRSAKL
jgi:hypothetical protein